MKKNAKATKTNRRKGPRKDDELAKLWDELRIAILHGRESLKATREYVPAVKVYRLDRKSTV